MWLCISYLCGCEFHICVVVYLIFVWLCIWYFCGCVFNIYLMIADKSVRQGRDSCVTAPGPSRPFQLAFCRTHSLPSRRRPHIGLFKTHTHTLYTLRHTYTYTVHTHARPQWHTQTCMHTHIYIVRTHHTWPNSHTWQFAFTDTHTKPYFLQI